MACRMQQWERESNSKRVQINETATKSKMYGAYSCSLPTKTLSIQKICSRRVEFVLFSKKNGKENKKKNRQKNSNESLNETRKLKQYNFANPYKGSESDCQCWIELMSWVVETAHAHKHTCTFGMGDSSNKQIKHNRNFYLAGKESSRPKSKWLLQIYLDCRRSLLFSFVVAVVFNCNWQLEIGKKTHNYTQWNEWKEKRAKEIGRKSALVTNRFNNIHRTNGKSQKLLNFLWIKRISLALFLTVTFRFHVFDWLVKKINKIQVDIPVLCTN